jgi:hypothetical protein
VTDAQLARRVAMVTMRPTPALAALSTTSCFALG